MARTLTAPDPRAIGGGLDEAWMALAFDAAEAALAGGDCPFGAAVGKEGELLAVCASTEHSAGSTTRHAEMNALAAATATLGVPLLHGATLYSTHEPCLMCTGALLHAQVDRLVVATLRDDVPARFRQRR